MNIEFMNALSEIENEKGIKKEVLVEAIEMALISAYKKHYGNAQNARVDIDSETGEIKVFEIKNIVEEVEDEDTEITYGQPKNQNPPYEIGDVNQKQVTPKQSGGSQRRPQNRLSCSGSAKRNAALYTINIPKRKTIF